MLFGTVLVGAGAAMLWGGWTGQSPIGEIRRLLAGEAAFVKRVDPAVAGKGGETLPGGGGGDGGGGGGAF